MPIMDSYQLNYVRNYIILRPILIPLNMLNKLVLYQRINYFKKVFFNRGPKPMINHINNKLS